MPLQWLKWLLLVTSAISYFIALAGFYLRMKHGGSLRWVEGDSVPKYVNWTMIIGVLLTFLSIVGIYVIQFFEP